MAAKILGKLRGIIASASEKSRNGRFYTEQFWDDIFNSELFKEGLENRTLVGECFHPDDDAEYSQIHIDPLRAAIVLTKVEKQGLDYYGTFDILPTIAGETVKNLSDVGCIFGISSRGYSDYDVDTYNDASIYDLITFDLVAFPGIKSARLYPVTAVSEAFNKRKVNKEKIMENIHNIIETKANNQLKEFIQNTLKKKEDFDIDIQSDEFDDYIEPDLKDYMIVISCDDEGIPFFDNGIDGKHVVKTSLTCEPNAKYLVDDIYFDDKTNTYTAIGDWLKIT